MPEQFDLVFRGGGIKGAGFVGALEVLASAKHTTRRLIGTSAGAIFATGWAAGFTPEELLKKVAERKNEKLIFASFLTQARKPDGFNDVVWRPLVSASDALVRKAAKLAPKIQAEKAEGWGGKSLALTLGGALCDDVTFRDWMTEVLKAKGFDGTTTLKAFHAAINKVRPQQLTLVASDITGQQVLLLNERTAPALPVVEAVRMSMSIPFVWKEIVWLEKWGTYHGQDIAGHQIVDGGLLSNFPMRYFLDPHYARAEGEMGQPPGGGEANVVGLLLDNAKTPPDLAEPKEDHYLIEALPAVRLGSKLLDTLLDTWDKEALRQLTGGRDGEHICRIGTKGIGALEFDMPDDRMNALVNSGRCAMKDYLAARKKK